MQGGFSWLKAFTEFLPSGPRAPAFWVRRFGGPCPSTATGRRFVPSASCLVARTVCPGAESWSRATAQGSEQTPGLQTPGLRTQRGKQQGEATGGCRLQGLFAPCSSAPSLQGRGRGLTVRGGRVGPVGTFPRSPSGTESVSLVEVPVRPGLGASPRAAGHSL